MTTGGDFSRTLEGELFYDFPCSLCEKDGKHIEAVKYCEECFVFMCGPCVVYHQRFPLNISHQLLQQSRFETVAKSRLVSFPTNICLNHSGEFVNIYCGNHDVVCCSACKALEHGNCVKTQHLIDAAKGVQISQEYKNIKKEMNILLTDVVRVLADLKADISRIDNEKQNVKQTIADFRKKVNKYFDDLEEQSLDKLNNKAKSCQEDIKDLVIMKSNTEDILKQLHPFKEDNECDLFIQVKTGKQFLSNAIQTVHNISKSEQKDVITFRIDPTIEQFFSSIEVLGTFTDATLDPRRLATVPAGTNMNQPRAPIISSHTFPDNRDPLPRYKAQLHGKFDAKKKSYFTDCEILDICQVPDGTILITDYENMKLRRLDQSYKPLNSLRLPSKPHSVCNAGPATVAVSLRDANKVQFISVGKKLTLTRSFSTGNCCRGMVYVDGKLFVCCGNRLGSSSGCIEVYNNTGQLQYSIPHAPRGLCSVPLYITVSDDGQHLLVTSHNSDDVTMMDLSGNVINTFSDTNLKQPGGICSDGNCHILICGFYSSTVVQLEPEQQKLDIILGEEDGVKDPRAICYDKKQSRLLVSCRKSNELLVFCLK